MALQPHMGSSEMHAAMVVVLRTFPLPFKLISNSNYNFFHFPSLTIFYQGKKFTLFCLPKTTTLVFETLMVRSIFLYLILAANHLGSQIKTFAYKITHTEPIYLYCHHKNVLYIYSEYIKQKRDMTYISFTCC